MSHTLSYPKTRRLELWLSLFPGCLLQALSLPASQALFPLVIALFGVKASSLGPVNSCTYSSLTSCYSSGNPESWILQTLMPFWATPLPADLLLPLTQCCLMEAPVLQPLLPWCLHSLGLLHDRPVPAVLQSCGLPSTTSPGLVLCRLLSAYTV